MYNSGKRKRLFKKNTMLALSLVLNLCLTTTLLVWYVRSGGSSEKGGGRKTGARQQQQLQENVQTWHGGHPAGKQTGSCWCSGTDRYCMCNPSLAIDVVITSGPNNDLWLVRRKDTNQLATMGGFVNVGETAEHAVVRELQEEMGISLLEGGEQKQNARGRPALVGVYSDPRRDNRRHTASAVYAVHLDGTERPAAADDVKAVERIPMADIEKHQYFADHKTILLDYRRALRERDNSHNPRVPLWPSEGDFANDIERSIC